MFSIIGMRMHYEYWAIAIILFCGSGCSFENKFVVPSNSMAPTLFIGDEISLKLLNDSDKELKRGDIVLYSAESPKGVYFKRIVGVPGDRVEIRSKKLFINKKEIQQQQLSESECRIKKLTDEMAAGIKFDCYKETLGDASYKILWHRGFSVHENFGPLIVSPNHYFILGDNRDGSNDSRLTGVISKNSILELVIKIKSKE